MLNYGISLVLVNAHVLAMERIYPDTEAVAIIGDRIFAVDSNQAILALASSHTRIIDCGGLTLLPGFNDAHCHLPGLARRMQDLDCSPQQASSISELQTLVRDWAETREPGSWIRGFGYDDLRLSDRRHPDRHDLDAAAPSHPVWIEHRSGHASVLNTLALHLAGIHRETPDPAGGVIERDPATGEPTGLLYEMQAFIRERLGNIRSFNDFESGMRAVGRLLVSYGITSVQDAGASNGIERWNTFRRLQSDGVLPCRITMFAGIGRLEELSQAGLHHGSGDHWLRLGHAKIVMTLTAGTLHPSYAHLEAMIAQAHDRGFPVAIHCIEEEAIAAAATALQANISPGLNDRIEHCAECTPLLIDAVRGSGATVVTQPGFIFHNGPSYREHVATELLPHLYPVGALLRAGVATASGSDAPVIDPNPWPAIYSAVTRRAEDRHPLADQSDGVQAVSVDEALLMYTLCSARAEGTSKDKGSIAPGKLADLVLVDADPLSIDPERLPDVKALMTVSEGVIVWENKQGRV